VDCTIRRKVGVTMDVRAVGAVSKLACAMLGWSVVYSIRGFSPADIAVHTALSAAGER
jgi:hypothetical protein